MNSFIFLTTLTLTVLTAAVPHAGHSHRHLHLRPRAQSDIGLCGGDQGFTCGPGFCCSEWGYCGTSKEYCGAGCNPKWGVCGDNSTVSATATGTAYSTVTLSISSTVEASSAAALTAYSSASSEVSTAASSVVSSAASSSVSVAANTKAVNHPTWTGRPGWSSSVSSTSLVEQPSSTEAASAPYSAPAQTSAAAPTTPAAPSTTMVTSYAPAPSSYNAPAPTSETSAWSAPAPSSYNAPPSSTSSAPAATSSSSSSGGSGSGSDSYKLYTGDGSTSAGWPSQDSWVSFDSMWSANMAYISISCAQFGQADNSDSESEDIKSAISSIASSSGVDERFVLAVMMQESKGCVRAPTTNYGVVNPGLMQSHDGTGSCNNGGVQDPCPSNEITQMIKDGTTGTSSGDGLQQLISQCGASDVSKYYKAARMYNSGSIAASGKLEDGIATHCYASDIANRLTGWVKAATTCSL